MCFNVRNVNLLAAFADDVAIILADRISTLSLHLSVHGLLHKKLSRFVKVAKLPWITALHILAFSH